MTNEEAIKEIKRDNCRWYKNEEMCLWATEGFGSCKDCCYNKAITALEHQHCEDCISRAKLKEYISKDESTDFFKGWNRVIEAIYATAPSVQPKSNGMIEVLNKIRAEIQENINYNKKMNYQGIVAGLLLALEIIDKYRAESEDKE